MSENKKIFPREVKIIPADNGYLVKVGCKLYVIEGGSKNITEDLKRYLDCDKTIVEKFGYKGYSVFLNNAEPREVECEKKYCNEDNPVSPAFTYLNNSRDRLIKCIYQVDNGKVEIDIENKTALVYQKQFINIEEENI